MFHVSATKAFTCCAKCWIKCYFVECPGHEVTQNAQKTMLCC